MAVALVNRFRAGSEEAYESLLRAFKTRSGLVDKAPGFRGLLLLASRERREIVVVTFWDSRESMERWIGSEEFRRAHERARGGVAPDVEAEAVVYEVEGASGLQV